MVELRAWRGEASTKRSNAFGGADLVISGNVPQGAGLSSSASLEVAVGTVFQQLYHLPLDGAQIALNGRKRKTSLSAVTAALWTSSSPRWARKIMRC